MDYNIEELKLNIERLGGIATSKQLQEAGYTRMMIYDSLMKGLITKESHGSYRWTEQETVAVSLFPYKSLSSASVTVLFPASIFLTYIGSHLFSILKHFLFYDAPPLGRTSFLAIRMIA